MPQEPSDTSSLATLSDVPGTELRRLQATFEAFGEFVDRYSPWLSDSCIFVETLETMPVGAPVSLEIRLRHRPAMIQALGQVDWVRDRDDEAAGPPGVAVNISYLDPASARLLDSIFRLYTGQQSADLGEEIEEKWEHDVESLIGVGIEGNPSERSRSEVGQPRKPPPPEASSLPLASMAPETPSRPHTPAELSPPEPELLQAVPMQEPEETPSIDSPAPPAAASLAREDIEPMASPDAMLRQPGPEVDASITPPPTGPAPQWEANLSAAFSEAEAAEATTQASSFGFGLVEEPSPVPVELAAGVGAATGTTSLLEPMELGAARQAIEESVQLPIHTRSEASLSVAMADSDASFLRRSILMFLLALAVGTVLFVSFLRPRFAVPSIDEVRSDVPLAADPAADASRAAAGGPQTAADIPPPVTGAGMAPNASPISEPSGDDPPSGPEQPDAASAQTRSPATPAPKTSLAEIEELLGTWANAWSQQEPADFIACYAPDYAPPGFSHASWVQQRRTRIRSPTSILVQVKNLEVEVVDARRAVAVFYQDYETDARHLFTWKTMELERLAEGWRIVAERAGR